MGRKKKIPHRAVGVRRDNEAVVEEEKIVSNSEGDELVNNGGDEPYFVQLDRASWGSDNHYDISEIVLSNLDINAEIYGFTFSVEFYKDSRYLLRFKLNDVGEYLNRMRLGHWPVLSVCSICLQFVERRLKEGVEEDVVLLSGNLDGPDEAVSGLVHLASLGFLTLRPVMGMVLMEDTQSLRMRVEILETAFGACDSLLENTRELWKKSMMNVMAWLRPEVLTSEARYGYKPATCMVGDSSSVAEADPSALGKRGRFDVAGFYEAIKPSKEEPMLEDNLPGLLPELRPYQRRAAYWMVQRERGISESSKGSEKNSLAYPLCMPMNLIDTSSRMYYNPFCGNISLCPEEYSDSYVPGGILADEMGLGKTVELLACIFANRASSHEVLGFPHTESPEDGIERSHLRRLRRERVECVCGAVNDSYSYKGLWVQCDACDAWQHADCVGFSAKGRIAESRNGQKRREYEVNSKKHDKENNDIVVMDGAHICKMCSELIQATESPVATAATLIICPTPILSQWHAEIVRHTNTGSLRILVYEGIKNSSFSDAPAVDIKDLINADVVLTSYDVLKEDLSHDSDRHEGDRRTMRFQKRYPVVPTLLTRIFWWRVCLDEAQMVESNAAASTEMALRLHAKHRWCITGTPIQKKLDDLYGLLKFLKASPFDVFRWWTDVISKPYEEGDAGARIFTQNFLKNILWRSSKAHVEEELNIPPQEECVSWLSLSQIEAHFYQRQHETCVKDAQEVVKIMKEAILKRNPSGSKSPEAISEHLITHLEAVRLFKSLLKLRQACCHPQVGSSGLRALQQSPMTMQEILSALVGKTKIEGEEALRKVVSAINGLAGIAILKDDFPQAVSLYKEALSLAEENSEDFRLDPLLNIHIHHNLAEVLFISDCTDVPRNSTEEVSTTHEIGGENQRPVKKARLAANDPGLMIEPENLSEEACKSEPDSSCQIPDGRYYSSACEHIRQRFLSVFYSKLSGAQQEFRKAYEQVSDEFSNKRNLHTAWWLEALHQIEQNKDLSTELIKKIRESISSTLNTSRESRISSCFRSISTLKYFIQTGLDSLEESRKSLLDRLLEIDSTMGSPREEDFIRVRNCPSCYTGDGVLCVHCELDDLFQAYEARLFRLNKGSNGESLISAQDAVDFQKKRSALNRFYQTLSKNGKKGTLSESKYEGDKKKRDVKEKVMVSKSPSDLEVVLGIIRNNSKGLLDGEGTSAATKQLLLLEAMRKEYALARSLAIVQAQVLCAYDEIKMATCRLRLKEDPDDDSIDALSPDEIDAASTQNSSDKFLELSSLSRIKGQLRYLKGLVCSEQNLHSDDPSEPIFTGCRIPGSSPVENGQTHQTNKFLEACPVCQEKLSSQKMVFQCGHVTCCDCLFAMTERKTVHHGRKWVMCPTCRQHTDFGSIALADDRHSSSDLSSSLACEKSEQHMTVQGSYSTKIEAVVRRILSITSADPTAKVLVFTSWNDVLDVLEHAFAANRISYVRMKGGRKSHIAVSYFRGQNVEKRSGKSHEGTPDSSFVQVLLILFQHGANGLNLLEAKHVILVEPLLNPAVEAQAIGRVHRIGQENRTLVHRFIVKDTVEESIYKLNRSRNTGSIVSGSRKNQDLPVLTLKDVESLFRVASSTGTEEEKAGGSLRNLPPSVAAAIAAERRLAESREQHL